MSRAEACLSILEKHKTDGITLDDLMLQTSSTKSSAYTAISDIRNDLGYNITTKLTNGKNRYFLGAKHPVEKKKPTRHYTPRFSGILNPDSCPFALPKGYHKLPDNEKQNFIDLIGKAQYYYRCAEQLIKSEQFKNTILI